MAIEPNFLPTRHKADQHLTTLVIQVHTADCAIIGSLMEAYKHTLPPKLIDMFEQCMRQLPK